MRKFFTVLLVAVLAVGIGFAGFKGSASLGFGLDLDGGDWGFKNATDIKGDFTFEFGKGEGGTKGEGDIYAEIAASFNVTFKFDAITAGTTPLLKSGISAAKIHFVIAEEKEIVVDILGPGTCPNYAAGYWDDDADGEIDLNAVAFPKIGPDGFGIGFMGWNAGVGMGGNIGAKTYEMAGYLETQEFKFAENGFVQAAVYGALGNTGAGKDIGFAVKGGYKVEDGLNIDAAVDFHGASKTALNVETGVNFALAPVAVNLYYTNVGADNLNALINLTFGEFGVSIETRKVITDARTLGLGFTGKAGEVSFGADFRVDDFVKKEFHIGANAGGFADLTITLGVDLKATTGLSLKVVYNPDILKATLDLGFDFAETATTFKPGLTVETEKLISKAKVSFGYTGAEFGSATPKKGAFKLGCEVKF